MKFESHIPETEMNGSSNKCTLSVFALLTNKSLQSTILIQFWFINFIFKSFLLLITVKIKNNKTKHTNIDIYMYIVQSPYKHGSALTIQSMSVVTFQRIKYSFQKRQPVSDVERFS